MTELKIARHNYLTGAKHEAQINFNQTLTSETLQQMHWLLETLHPDEGINFTFNNGFICGSPLNMKMDSASEMPFDVWFAKWYPDLKDKKQTL